MSLSVAGKYAVITGAGSGINLAFAKLLLQRGCSVMIGDLNLRPEARDLLKQYPSRPGTDPRSGHNPPTALFQETNVRSWPQLNTLWSTALTSFPHIDIVVPGAGLFEPSSSSFWNAPRTTTNPSSSSRDPADADPGGFAIIDINLVHPARMSQLAIGLWSQRRRPGTFATKHGVTALVRSLGDLSGGGREMLMQPEEVAEAMLALCEDPEYGDGTILEVIKGQRRVVPLFNADPPGPGCMLPGFAREQDALKKRIKGGFSV